MPWVNGEYRWTVAEKLADLTSGLYGDEYGEKSADLKELVDAVRRDWAGWLRERTAADGKAKGLSDPRYQEILADLANDLDPDVPDDRG